MGLESKDIALLAAMLGSSVIGGVTAPQGQKLKSFENGKGGIDPTNMMGKTNNLLTDYLNVLTDEASKPVTINTTAAPLPIFKGGALPMPVAAMAMDPNRFKPSLRTLGGVDHYATGAGRPPDHGPGGPIDGQPGNDPDGPPVSGPLDHGDLQMTSQSQGGTPDHQAAAAAELLTSLTGGGGSSAPRVNPTGGMGRRRLAPVQAA